MSQHLMSQQSELLEVLFVETSKLIANYSYTTGGKALKSLKNSPQIMRGLRAYRANAQALAVTALQSSYPTLLQLLGEENFSHLAQDFWQVLPPQRGDWAQWGSELAAYLPLVPQLQTLLQEHAYLPDVARVEWALHVAATATDAELDRQSFELLASHDPAQLRLRLIPGCALLRSAYPVVAIMYLHDARESNAHTAAREAIAKSKPQNALIWRQGFRPMLSAIDDASAALIEATLQGQSLVAAIDAAMAAASDFDFSAWLAASVQSGLLLGVTAAVHPTT